MRIMTAFAAATVASAGAVVGAPIALADDGELATHEIGEQARLDDGTVVQGWTITDLKTSTDAIPYQVQGTLWEATATDEAIEGAATPIVSNLNARTSDGQTYRALFQVPTPEGVNPATLAPGETTTGKVYFDVTGAEPESVVYNGGGSDLIVWEEAQPSSNEAQVPASTPSGASGTQTAATPAGAEQTAPAPEEAAGEPTAPGAAEQPATPDGAEENSAAPSGSQATPLQADGEPDAAPTGRSGTPLPADTEPAPRPAAASEGTPAPAGSQGTPLPDTSHGPAVSHGTPAP